MNVKEIKKIYEGVNILPMRSDISAPSIPWTPFQTEIYPQDKIDFYKPIIAVLGEISGNLIDIEPDLPKEFKKNNVLTKDQTAEVYKWFTGIYPFLKDGLVIRTKSGSLRFLNRVDNYDDFYKLGNKNVYNLPVHKQFDGFEIEHVELRGNDCLSALAPSKMNNGREYTFYNTKSIQIIQISDIKKIYDDYHKFEVIETKNGLKRKNNFTLSNTPTIKSGNIRPCFIHIIENKIQLTGGDGGRMRLGLSNEYLNEGYTIPEVIELFRTQDDFDYDKTEYQVNFDAKKRYNPCKCKTIDGYKYCMKGCTRYYRRKNYPYDNFEKIFFDIYKLKDEGLMKRFIRYLINEIGLQETKTFIKRIKKCEEFKNDRD